MNARNCFKEGVSARRIKCILGYNDYRSRIKNKQLIMYKFIPNMWHYRNLKAYYSMQNHNRHKIKVLIGYEKWIRKVKYK